MRRNIPLVIFLTLCVSACVDSPEPRRQHFVINQPRDPSRYSNSAKYEAHQIVCNLSWIISWKAEEGRIKDIAGDYVDVCL
jgi:hypothetical protein